MSFHPVEGYEGLYKVNSVGEVYSCRKNKVMSPGYNYKGGHKYVNLSKNGVVSKQYIHRLVATAFVPGYFEGAIVNHIDENPENNDHTNLEWCTYSHNSKHSNVGGHAKWYIVTRPDGATTLVYDLKRFCTYNGLSQGSMAGVCRGYRKQHKGFTVIGVKP